MEAGTRSPHSGEASECEYQSLGAGLAVIHIGKGVVRRGGAYECGRPAMQARLAFQMSLVPKQVWVPKPDSSVSSVSQARCVDELR